MTISALINEALKNIMSNRVRSFLTMLGIFIGVGAVIAMMAIGQGAKNSITDTMNTLGTQNLYVTPGNMTENVRNAQDLSNEDAAAVAALDCISIASPTVSSNYMLSHSNGNTVQTSVTGVVPGYMTVGNYELNYGTFISQENLDAKEMVAVIGSDINDTIFGSETYNSVGENIRIMGQPYRIIGVLKEKGSSSLGLSQDNLVLIPLTTAQSRLMTRQKNSVALITVSVKAGIDTKAAETEIEALLRDRHGIFEGNPDDFTVMNMQELVDSLGDIMGTFTLFLGGVAAISLLVGGIGIMNIMLVVVTERTREIGLRKALGAKNSDIQAQFLVESSVISLVGGVLGILFGVALAYAIAKIAGMNGTVINVYVDPLIVLLSTVFSISVGLFFGIYPANKAAKLEPVIALRTE